MFFMGYLILSSGCCLSSLLVGYRLVDVILCAYCYGTCKYNCLKLPTVLNPSTCQNEFYLSDIPKLLVIAKRLCRNKTIVLQLSIKHPLSYRNGLILSQTVKNDSHYLNFCLNYRFYRTQESFNKSQKQILPTIMYWPTLNVQREDCYCRRYAYVYIHLFSGPN